MSIQKIINKKDQTISTRRHRRIVAGYKGQLTKLRNSTVPRNDFDELLEEATAVTAEYTKLSATHKHEIKAAVARAANAARGHRAAHTRMKNERDRIANAINLSLQHFVDQLREEGVTLSAKS